MGRDVRRLVGPVTKRLGGFTASTLVNGLSALFIIVAVVRTSGASGWAAVAVGQTIGVIAGIFVMLGWGVMGPARAARTAADEVSTVVAESLLGRLVLWIPAVGAVVAWVLLTSSGSSAVVQLLMAITGATFGLNSQWCFVGRGRPAGLLLCDGLPRAAAAVLGGVFLFAGGALEVFAAVQLVGALCAVSVSAAHFGVRVDRASLPARPRQVLVDSWRQQWSALALNLVSTLYLAVPTIAVAQFVPGGVASFALADRVQKQANVALQPILQVLQGWVPAARNPAELRRRIIRALGVGAGLSIVAGTAFFLLSPWVAGLLGGGRVGLPLALTVPYAAVLAITVMSQCTGTTALVALGRTRAVLWSAVSGSVAGLTALGTGLSLFGVEGAAWSIVVAEAFVLGVQIRALGLELRIPRTAAGLVKTA